MITENWKLDAAELIGIDVDKFDEIAKTRNLTFSDYLDLGAAVAEEDIERVKEILRIEDIDIQTNVDTDIEEQDNSYAAVTPPSQQMPTQTQAQQPGAVQPPGEEETEQSGFEQRKGVDDLMPGDEVVVQDLGGNAVTTRVRAARGPGNTLVVMGKDGDAVVKRDKVVQTPAVSEDAELARLRKLAGIQETTSAGAIATAPVSVGEVQKRGPSKPTPKKKKEDASERKKKK